MQVWNIWIQLFQKTHQSWGDPHCQPVFQLAERKHLKTRSFRSRYSRANFASVVTKSPVVNWQFLLGTLVIPVSSVSPLQGNSHKPLPFVVEEGQSVGKNLITGKTLWHNWSWWNMIHLPRCCCTLVKTPAKPRTAYSPAGVLVHSNAQKQWNLHIFMIHDYAACSLVYVTREGNWPLAHFFIGEIVDFGAFSILGLQTLNREDWSPTDLSTELCNLKIRFFPKSRSR